MNGAWRRAGLFLLAVLLLSVPALAQPRGLPEDLSGDAEAQGFADLLFAHGMIQLAGQDYAAALPLFQKAHATLPGDATYAYFAALCKLRLGRYGESLTEFRATLPPAKGRTSEARIRYDMADAHYRLGQYADARRELRRSTALDEASAPAHFLLGLVEFALGDPGAAMGQFSRASALDKSYSESADYYRAVEAYEKGDIETARRLFESVLGKATDPGMTNSGKDWLGVLDQMGQAEGVPKNDFRFSYLMEHDDNPGQINEDVALTTTPIDSDIRGVFTLRAEHRPLISTKGNIGLVVNSYLSRHADFDQADLAGVQGVFQFAYGGDPLGFISGPLGYARVPAGKGPVAWLLQAGASNLSLRSGSFRRDLELASTVLVQEGDFGKFEFSLAYDDVTYFDPGGQPFSGHSTTLRLGQYFFLGQGPSRYLKLTIERTAHDTAKKGLERDSDAYQAEFALPLNERWNLFLLGAYRRDDYFPESAVDFGLSGPRGDDTIDAVAKLTLNLTRHAYLSFRYSLTERDSLAQFATYDRHVSSLGFTRQW